MTKQSLSDYTDIEYEILPIYQVIKNLSLETEKPLGLWLWRIARASCTDNEPLSDSNIVPLILRPDEKWRIQCGVKNVERTAPRPSHNYNSYLGWDGSWPKTGGHISRVPVFISWSLQKSCLTDFLSKNPSAPVNDYFSGGINIKEGITIHRTDFREWWIASDHGQLPRFWFGEQEVAKTDGHNLANQRHSKTAPSKSAIKDIVASIEVKENNGEYWHQATAIDEWLESNPSTKTTRNRLIKPVNDMLNTKGIKPISNAPRKISIE